LLTVANGTGDDSKITVWQLCNYSVLILHMEILIGITWCQRDCCG